ncbi:SMC-Scp complex subunit ScpB [Mucilaginibacter calamicampi]|uniref:SMC-Scp complex subunit ScpB n=1 Tax=Mucilaginibacter calamicampi TaxID=1302352 RepID=A0ABW2YTH2_9SPHI
MKQPELYIEALIFASEQSIRIEEIMYCLQTVFERDYPAEEVKGYIDNIQHKYSQDNLSIELVNINNGYQFLTKKQFHPIVNLLQLQRAKKKLSQAALETLAVVAYKQPVTKTEIEQIRGVNCDYSIQKLLEKELISISGKSDAVGKPLLYSTSGQFMDYFGMNNIDELPHLKELADNSSSIGEQVE